MEGRKICRSIERYDVDACDLVEPGALTSRAWWKSYRVSEAITTSTISNAITRGKESASKR